MPSTFDSESHYFCLAPVFTLPRLARRLSPMSPGDCIVPGSVGGYPAAACATRSVEEDPFAAATSEFRAFGITVTQTAHSGSRPSWVVAGRASRRWWLVPTAPAPVAAAGWSLFQPVLPGARLLKAAAVVASRLGMAPMLAQSRLHVSGSPAFAVDLLPQPAHCALFTGTEGPHRKSVVQVMDAQGAIKAFAKIACAPSVQSLLTHEARVLEQLHAVHLHSASLPTVMAIGEFRGATILVTDTVKHAGTRSPAQLLPAHLAFLHELSVRMPAAPTDGVDDLLDDLHARMTRVRDGLEPAWRSRLEGALVRIEDHPWAIAPVGFSHGDFTPWNCFLHDEGLYVFDWEYAGYEFPADYDLIHFLMALPGRSGRSSAKEIGSLIATLSERPGCNVLQAGARLLAYLATLSLRYADRARESGAHILDWEGSSRAAALLDHLLAPDAS